jgi:hypothetical protein
MIGTIMKIFKAAIISIIFFVLINSSFAQVESSKAEIYFNHPFPGDTKVQFFGSDSLNEEVCAISNYKDNIFVGIKRRPIQIARNTPSNYSLQCRKFSGEFVWEKDFEKWCIHEVIAEQDRVVVLVSNPKNVLEISELQVQHFDIHDGSLIKQIKVKNWKSGLRPFLFGLLKGSKILLLGDDSHFAEYKVERYGAIIDSEGEFVSDWSGKPRNLFTIPDGFIGEKRTGDCGQYMSLIKIDKSGNIVWESSSFNTPFSSKMGTFLNQSNGDFLIIGWQDYYAEGVRIAMIDSETGKKLWTRKHKLSIHTTFVNPIELREDRLIVFMKNPILFDNEGNLLDNSENPINSTEFVGLWNTFKKPLKVSPNQILVTGYGNRYSKDIKEKDIVWITIELPSK